MKKLTLLLSLFFGLQLSAINYCAPSSWGYAGNNVTGGGTASPTLVSNESQLKTALKSSNKVIIITQDITVSGQISTDKSNLTLMALPGVKLVNTTKTKDGSGILYLKGSNIILRNIIFEGPGAYDCDGKDNLTLDGAKNVWVDHCDFQDAIDGNFDIKGKSDNITVSWCRFRYLKAPTAGGPGGSDDHRFSNLIGSSSTDKPDDNVYNITYGYCWWDEGCKQRMTRCRNALIHYINCYWNSSVADYYVGPENVSSYFEGCTFAGKANSASKIWKPFNNTTNYCKFVNCSGNLPSDAGSVSAPSYTYDQLSANDAKNYVTNSSCGAGATLTVTNTAEVSSGCDSGGEPPIDPIDPEDPVTSSWWNFSDADFNALGTISEDIAVRGLHIVATSEKTIVIDANNKTLDGINFTHRLKLGGTGNAAYRHLWFDVTGSCTVTVYLMSASTTDTSARLLNVATGSFDNVASTMAAEVGTLVKQVYTYTGAATRIWLYSANSGINLYGVRLSYPSPTPTESTRLTPHEEAACKVLRQGRVLIIREDRTYDLLGNRL